MKVKATESALKLIEDIKAQHGEELLFHQSGGCCDGSAPMCYPRKEYMVGNSDVKLGEIGGANADADQSINYFLGVNGEVGPGELGAAYGTHGGQVEGQEEELMYEVYYSYPLNDGMTITPLLYVKEKASALEPDQTGVMVKTSFSF